MISNLKRYVSVACALVILFTSCFTAVRLGVSAAGVVSETTFDFDDGNLSTAIQSIGYANTSNSCVITDEALGDSMSKYLKLGIGATWSGMMVNFNYELQTQRSYKISYKIYAGKALSVHSGWYVGKDTGKYPSNITTDKTANDIGALKTNYNKTEFAEIYPTVSGYYYHRSYRNKWFQQEVTFTVGSKDKDDTFKYLSLVVGGEFNASEFKYICIDDVVIQDLGPAYTVNMLSNIPSRKSFDSIVGAPGEKLNLPDTTADGFTFEGWYTDSAFQNALSEEKYTIGTGDATLYAKYSRTELADTKFFDYETAPVNEALSSVAFTWNQLKAYTGEGTERAAAEIVETEDGNKVLSLGVGTKYQPMLANINYKLKPNTRYTVTYDIYSNSSKVLKAGTGWFIGKDTGKNQLPITNRTNEISIDNLKACFDGTNRLDTLFNAIDGGATYHKYSAKTWYTKSFTFDTGDKVTDEFKYLALYVNIDETNMSVYIDNLSIREVGQTSEISFANNIPEKITNNKLYDVAGTEFSTDVLCYPGYKVTGIYTDNTKANAYTKDKFTITNEAQSYYVEYAESDVYEFRFDNNDLSSAIESVGFIKNQLNNGYYKIVDDGTGGKCLEICAGSSWTSMIVNFKYKLEADTKYRISYRVNADKALSSLSGWYSGKSTGKYPPAMPTASSADDTAKLKNTFTKKEFIELYDAVSGNYYPSGYRNKWVQNEFTFIVGQDDIDSSFNNLALIFGAESNTGVYAPMRIDDIVITKIGKTSSITFKELETKEVISSYVDVIGSKTSIDALAQAGKRISKVYSDEAGNTEYSGEYFTVGETAQTFYVKYTPAGSIGEFKFENESDIILKKNSISVKQADKTEGITNKALALDANTRSVALLNYELKPNTEYVISLKYKGNVEGLLPRVYALAAKNDASAPIPDLTTDLLETRQCSFFGSHTAKNANDNIMITDNKWSKTDYSWHELSFSFTTNDKVTDEYKWLAIGGQIAQTSDVSGSGTLFIDDLVIAPKTEAYTVKYKVSYDGQTIDVPNDYIIKGVSVTLPTEITHPYVLKGWYYDSAFTKPVSAAFTPEKDTVIYGKAEYLNTYKLDFEDASQILFGGAGWTKLSTRNIADYKDPDNHVLAINVQAYNYHGAILNYQLRPNRIYEVSVKYRSSLNTNPTVALVAASFNDLQRRVGFSTGTTSSLFSDSVVPLVSGVNIPKSNGDWIEAKTTITTDQPVIDSEKKYLMLFISAWISTDIEFEIDDIVITDKGKFNPANVTIKKPEDWTKPIDATKPFNVSDWITGLFVIDKDDSSDTDGYWDSDSDGDDETDEEEENTTQVIKRKKKIIRKRNGSNLPWIIGGCVGGAVLIAAAVLVIILIKRKKKNKNKL